jgi:hypothetical protein
VSALDRRLARLEERISPAKLAHRLEHLTDDELEIHILDLSREIAAKPDVGTAEEIAGARARVEGTEARIVATAQKQGAPEYQRHLGFLQEAWAERSPGVEYVCDLFDMQWGYGDWEKPNVMARRRALRERPDIAALIQKATTSARAGCPRRARRRVVERFSVGSDPDRSASLPRMRPSQ